MTGPVEFDQCTRGFYFSLCSLFVGVIYCTLATAGVRFFGVFADNWKSLCAKKGDCFACKNVLITIHSPAFGGRGIFVTSKKRAIVCRSKCSSASRISYSFGTPLSATHFVGRFSVLWEWLKTFGVFVLGVDTMLYDMKFQCSMERLAIKQFIACAFMIWGLDFLSNFLLSAQFAIDSSKCCRNVLLAIKSLAYGGKEVKNVNTARKLSQIIDLLRNYRIDYYSILRALVFVIGAFVCGLGVGLVFDLSCGFPGEGPVSDWSKKHPNLSLATWNTRSLTFERFYYCQSLGYDVLALTELWRNAPKFADGTVRWTHGEAKKDKITGLPIYPRDKAAGVGILLSARAQTKYISHGSPCERICWVRLKGPTVNLFIVAVYMPHRARVHPAQHNTMLELTKMLKEAPSNDCIVLLGDFNEQLQSNVKGCTGKWGLGEASKNADSVLDLMRMFNLCAANTFFKPKKNCSNATYLAPDNSHGITTADQEFVGRKVKARYKGAVYSGVVQGLQVEGGKGKWTVRFADGYICKLNRKNLGKILRPLNTEAATEKQIDYVMVSQRWMSCVKQSKSCWGPSIHRNKYGRADHALVNCIWKWRVRIRESKPGPNWQALKWEHHGGGSDDADPTIEAEPSVKEVFSSKLKEKLDLQANQDNEHQDDDFNALDEVVATRLPLDSESRYDSLCKAIYDTAKETLPAKKSLAMKERCVSARTSHLFNQREKMTRKKNSKEQYSQLQRQIKDSSLQDFKDWVEECTEEMESASAVGDTKKIYQLVQHLSKKALPPPRNLTHDSEGRLLKSPEEIAAMWFEFLKSKFKETEKESCRAPMPPLPTERTPSDSLTRREFDAALKRLGCAKAAGPDGVPIEAFKFCQVAKDELFAFLQQIWEEERLPQNFTQAKFVMLFKNKGSHKDPSKYRCIGLLNHSYKILSIIILMRLLHASEGFLPDWQAGFRAGRGCRDNSFILRTLCDQVMALGESIAVTFIDYSAAFDTVSHRFLDEALAQAGAPVKVRAMFRAVYSSASAFTTVPAPDGKKVKSNVFSIRRGVVQGDITSPLYFILALELILRRHDSVAGKGVTLTNTVLHSLVYADDVALIDQGDSEGIQRATTRVSIIASGSRDDANMEIRVVKTKVLRVRRQETVITLTRNETKEKCNHVCPHLNCGFRFLTERGEKIHSGKCKWRHDFEVEKILNCEHPPTNRKYLIKCEDYSIEHNLWIPRNS